MKKIIFLSVLLTAFSIDSNSQTIGAAYSLDQPNISWLLQMHVKQSPVRVLILGSYDTNPEYSFQGYGMGVGIEHRNFTITPYYQVFALDLDDDSAATSSGELGVYLSYRIPKYKRWHVATTYDNQKGFGAGLLFELDKK